MKNDDFTIAHISDLHFSSGTDKGNQEHSHSIELLHALQNKIKSFKDIDHLIVSGDISNKGDKQSLINASEFIFGKLPIGDGEHIGLELPEVKTGIVPGNHDAWNSAHSGTLLSRRQKSLENYNFAFNKHKIPSSDGCYYKLLEKDGDAIFIAYVDSCFLGDTEKHPDSTFGNLRYDKTIAKGKLTVDQTEKLLEWHDLGTRGSLLRPDSDTLYIDKEIFSKSLKILVMHHYLFEPPEHKSDYFMSVQHRDIVFRNIALSDYDILLCGHKHIPSFDIHSYGHHFDRRATNRYLINYFRRLIGLHSLPIQFEDKDGDRWTKKLSLLTATVCKMFVTNKPEASSEEIADEVLKLLKEGLDNPESLEKKVKKYLGEKGISGADGLEGRELKNIRKRISVGLTLEERKQLKSVANSISDMSKSLKSRAFLQIMSGSSGKARTDNSKTRSFNIYKINKEKNSWKIISERFIWDSSSNEFLENGLEQQHVFRKKI